MSIYRIEREVELPISLNEAWNFFSSPANLKEITPKELDFNIISGWETGKMYAGMIIRYTVRPLLGIKMEWVTEITQVVEGKHFIDEQRFGPYSFWHHQHFFEELPNGNVKSTDIVHYKIPLGFLGVIAHSLFVKRMLNNIFDHRNIVLKERFTGPRKVQIA